jgi:hypothetical protein
MQDLKRANLKEITPWVNLWQARANDCFVKLMTSDQNLEVFVRPIEFAERTSAEQAWHITAVGVSLVDVYGQVLATEVRHIPRAINL